MAKCDLCEELTKENARLRAYQEKMLELKPLETISSLKAEVRKLEEKYAQLESACYDGCATGDNVFDELKRTIARAETAEAALAKAVEERDAWQQAEARSSKITIESVAEIDALKAALAKAEPVLKAIREARTPLPTSVEFWIDDQFEILKAARKYREEA